MKKNALTILVLFCVIITQAQTLFQGKVEINKDESNRIFLFEDNSLYYVIERVSPYEADKDSPSPKLFNYKIEGNVLKKSIATELNMSNKILKAKEYFLAGSKANSCVLFAYSLELVDFSYTIQKGTKGQLNVEKYDLKGDLKATLKVVKKAGTKKEFFFHAMISQNGDYIGVVNNDEYTVYSTENFALLHTFKLNSIPNSDIDKSRFYILNDGSLVYLTLTNPVNLIKCDVKSSKVITSQFEFKYANNFSPYFQLSEDQSYLMFACVYNDKKSESSTKVAKGFQVVGVNLEDMKISDDLIYDIDDELKEALEFDDDAEEMAILGMHKTEDGFILTINYAPIQYRTHSTLYFQKDIVYVKLNKSDNSFKIQKRDDVQADNFFIDDKDKTYLIYSSICKFKPTGAVTSKSKLFVLEVNENIEINNIFTGDFSKSQAKMVGLNLYKASPKSYFMFNIDDEKIIPLLFTIE